MSYDIKKKRNVLFMSSMIKEIRDHVQIVHVSFSLSCPRVTLAALVRPPTPYLPPSPIPVPRFPQGLLRYFGLD